MIVTKQCLVGTMSSASFQNTENDQLNGLIVVFSINYPSNRIWSSHYLGFQLYKPYKFPVIFCTPHINQSVLSPSGVKIYVNY